MHPHAFQDQYAAATAAAAAATAAATHTPAGSGLGSGMPAFSRPVALPPISSILTHSTKVPQQHHHHHQIAPNISPPKVRTSAAPVSQQVYVQHGSPQVMVNYNSQQMHHSFHALTSPNTSIVTPSVSPVEGYPVSRTSSINSAFNARAPEQARSNSPVSYGFVPTPMSNYTNTNTVHPQMINRSQTQFYYQPSHEAVLELIPRQHTSSAFPTVNRVNDYQSNAITVVPQLQKRRASLPLVQNPAYTSNSPRASPAPPTSIPAPTTRQPKVLPSSVPHKESKIISKLKKQCPVCGKVCSRPSTLKTHYLIHTGDTPFKCSWTDCDKAFNVKSNMLRHVKCHEKRLLKKKRFPLLSKSQTVKQQSRNT